jgi:GLPGLI family protein
MKFTLNVFFLISSFLITYASSAQKTLESGHVKMEITAVSADDPQTEMMLASMKGSQTEVFFRGNEHVTSMDMMGGMIKTKTHISHATNTMNMLFDMSMMGQKTWVESKLDDTLKPEDKERMSKTKITYDKKDTKTILGYNCYKMTISSPDMEGMNVTGYVTEQIKTKANLVQGFQSLEFAGYTMEFTVSSPQFAMTMTAVEVSDNVVDANFVLDTKGYKKMTMAEFQQAMGGMGGGFGF